MTKTRTLPLIIFFSFFGLYLATMFPSLAPYRDSGEMATSAYTLGVSHPTGYPLYILLGRMMNSLPIGNPAYRLSLLSALAAALALVAVYQLCARRFGSWAGIGASVLLGLNADFWAVAQVQEMYTLWILAAAILMFMALELKDHYRERLWLAFAMFYGLALGNRLDLLLWAPGLLWLALGSWDTKKSAVWASFALVAFPAAIIILGKNSLLLLLILGTVWWRYQGQNPRQWLGKSAVFAVLGLSVYAYLPLRSLQAPWLDWNHPAVFSNLMETILRSKYGGTLDLISTNYATGELFGANMILYAKHLWSNFSLPGIVLCLWGCWASWRHDRSRWLGFFTCYWWSGPVFLFMANMPPNPHAAAIVEPHYLYSDLILVLWAGEGLGALDFKKVLPGICAALLAVAPLAQGRLKMMDRRFHVFSYDYARNIFLCAPPSATIVAKKDVQLYTLWYYQTAQGFRPDIHLVAQGLAGAPWYQNQMHRQYPELYVSKLADSDGWKRLLELDAPAFAAPDADVPGDLAVKSVSQGLLNFWQAPAPQDSRALWNLMTLRGNYVYEEQPDFFTSDLIENYAQSLYKFGNESYKAGHSDEALSAFYLSWAMHWIFPDPANFIGFIAFSRQDFSQAFKFYGFAAELSRRMSEMAVEYYALPGVKSNLLSQQAQAFMQLGVTSGKLGNIEQAAEYYRQSLAIHPSAEAHYDYAVLYWNKDWGLVQKELQEALKVDPNYAPAAKYFSVLQTQRK